MTKPIVLAFTLVLTCCSIIDFSADESVNSNPDTDNQIIGENEKIYISFSFEPERNSAESLFKVSDYRGDIDGDFLWEGKELCFIPSEKLIKGRRYTLSFSGSVDKKEGGQARVELLVPFYYICENSSVPFVSGISPPGGSVIGTEDTVRVVFSKPIDTGSFKKGFSVSPEKEYTLTWENENKEVIIDPLEKWENLTSYTFSFSSDICCTQAMPLEEESEITFYVDSSHTNPQVISTETAMRDIASSFPALSQDLDSIKYNDAIKIVFSEDMDKESTESAFSIEPYTAGRKMWIGKKTLIFLPETFWRWEEKYRLSISSSAESENGITLAEKYSESFTADISELHLSSLDGKADDGFPISSFSESSFMEITTDPVAPYTYNFIFNFSESFASDNDKLKAQDSTNISCVFPPDGTSPFPRKYIWLSDTSLSVEYSGFTPYNSISNIHYYYLLKIKGGAGGIINSMGSYLSEDIKQLLRTK